MTQTFLQNSIICITALLMVSCAVMPSGKNAQNNTADSIIWNVDNLSMIGGHEVTVIGSPKIIDAPTGKAVLFDGANDGLFIENNPAEGMEACTIEVLFRPDEGGLAEQRFVHIQERETSNRYMIETRLPGDGTWYADTFVASGEYNRTLKDERFRHDCNEWHTAAIVFDGHQAQQYVNGKLELTANLEAYTPMKPGQTSLGVRQNKVYWFKGAIARLRVTPRALSPEELMTP